MEQEIVFNRNVMSKDVLNHLVQFMSPQDAVAFTRTCRFIHASVDLKLANWRPHLIEIVEKLEKGEKIDDETLIPGLIQVFAANMKLSPETESDRLCASIVKHGEELKDYHQQLQSKGKHGADYCFWLGYVTKSVLYSLTQDLVSRPGGVICKLLWCAMFISKDKLGLETSSPYIANFFYYVIPGLVVMDTIRASYLRYQSLIADNQSSASARLPGLITALKETLKNDNEESSQLILQ